MERKYSLSEIDRMRDALHEILTPAHASYSSDSLMKRAEDQLRTYLLAGIDPEELERKAQAKVSAEEEEAAAWHKEIEEARLAKEYGPRS